MPSVTYQIRVVGPVPADVFDDFEGVSILSVETDTTLRADLVDVTALHGLLAALRHEGLVLLDLRRDLFADDDTGILDLDDAAQTSSTASSAELDESRLRPLPQSEQR